MEQEFNFNQLKMELYGNRVYVTQKWVSNFGKLSQYADYGTYIGCIKEAFNVVEIVMGNTIYNFRHKFNYIERVSLGVRNGRDRYAYRYEGIEEPIDYSMASTFFGKAKILRAIHFNIPEELDDVRTLRNMTTHNTYTMVGTVADQTLSYERVFESMRILGLTLHRLGLLRAQDMLPEYEKMRVHPGDSVGYSGEYQVEDFVAEGGMSRVYRGLHTRLNREVAIKELKPYTYRSDQIQNEKQFLVSLENSQIPQIFDVFNQNGTYYIVMEFIDGVGLSQYVRDVNPDMDERLAIAVQICKVLRYIHNDCGMVYADLKPENVMIDRMGRVFLIDFGISQLAEENVSAGAYSQFYSSPEQMTGKPIDRRSDIYSLGSILQFLFGYNNDRGGITYAEGLGDYVEEMQNLCEICKRENPEDRFRTIEEVEGHLRWIKNMLIQQPKAKKRTVRRVILIGLITVAAFLLAGILTWYHIMFPPETITVLNGDTAAIATQEGVEITFSCMNRSDSVVGDSARSGYFIARFTLGFNYKDPRDNGVTKTKARNYDFEYSLTQQKINPGELLKDQKYVISWDEIRTTLEQAGIENIPEISEKNVNAQDAGTGKVVQVAVIPVGF